uniref:Uncharacterized protein n=1 Tax=Canis lupus dingo TaxID=286419 RepID=A0A8C0KES1_CANLU
MTFYFIYVNKAKKKILLKLTTGGGGGGEKPRKFNQIHLTMDLNCWCYPAHLSRGSALKYRLPRWATSEDQAVGPANLKTVSILLKDFCYKIQLFSNI